MPDASPIPVAPPMGTTTVPDSKRRKWVLLPPLLAFVAVNLVFFMAAEIDGYDYWEPMTWVRWDAEHYIDIADNGYEAYPCTIFRFLDWEAMKSWTLDFLGLDVVREETCGNAGWYPGYPGAIRVVSTTGLSPPAASVMVAVTLQLATLYGLWIWFLKDRDRLTAVVALAAGAFFFGHVFYRAAYPLSMVTFLLLVHIHLVRHDRWVWGGLSGAAVAFVYPTGFVVAMVDAGWLWAARRDLALRERFRIGTILTGIAAVGFAAVHLLQWKATGIWGAFFKVQSQFGYGIHLPTERLHAVISPLFTKGLTIERVPALQTLVVTVLVLWVLTVVILGRRDLSSTEWWVGLGVGALWLFPLMLGGETSLYRIHSVLLPAVILLPRLPRPAQIATAAVAAAISYPMAILFFRNFLV